MPLLTLFLDIDIHYAIGASLIAVIATSTTSSSNYIKNGFTNIRSAIFLETATTLGAISGVFIGVYLSASFLSLIFGLVLLYSALSSFFSNGADVIRLEKDKIATYLSLNNSYPSEQGQISYNIRNVPLGWFIMWLAGVLSGLLGIGSGALKVIALDHVMGFPFKVSTTTSNLMIGVTAAASAGIYFHLGYIDPILCFPVMLGVITGSSIGAKLLHKIKTKSLKRLFASLVLIISFQMIYGAIK